MQKARPAGVIMTFNICLARAQENDSLPATFMNNNDPNLNAFLGQYLFFYEHREIDTLCLAGTAFIKFKLDSTGYVSSADVNEGTPKILAEHLLRALSRTNGHWIIKRV